MKINKIQKEIFALLMKEEKRLGSAKMSETETLFTDGYKAFVLPDKVINFNTAKIQIADSLKDVIKEHPGDKLLTLTNDLRILRYKDKETARKLTLPAGEYFETADGRKTTEVWVNSKFLEYFENPSFYTYGHVSRIRVVEPIVSQDACAVILPIRMSQ